jgi:hypothetical protein
MKHRSSNHAFKNPQNEASFPTAILFIAAGLLLSSIFSAKAANPATGSVNSTPGSKVEWVGNALGGATDGEGDCVDGISCDVFTLTVGGQPSDWVGKGIEVKITWMLGANDYDMVIHKGSVTGDIVGSSGGGAPFTSERSGINPSASGTGVYVVHVVYFAVPDAAVDQYHGVAETKVRPPERSATHLKGGGITFSPNVTVKAPNTVRDGEPSCRADFLGNYYVAGIRGVPAGVDLWYFDLRPSSPNYDPLMRNPIYRGQPDSFTNKDSTQVGADGGGDVELAVGFGLPAGQTDPTLSFSSLVAANISAGTSLNRGATFNLNPVGNAGGGVPVDDRQWQEFFGDHTVFLSYRTVAPVIAFVQRSTDGGFTFEPATLVGPSAQNGYIDVNQTDGSVYCFFNDGRVAVGTPTTPGGAPAAYTFYQAADDFYNVDHKFFIGKVAEDGTANGTVYVCYSTGYDVYIKHSTDKGVTWSLPTRVSDIPNGASVFPWMETGTAPGSVVVAWYGSENQAYNNSAANWKVYFAQSLNAKSTTPTFTQAIASDHFIHGSNISEGGLTGTANRNLIDYFQIAVDPQGAAVIGYADDHNDLDGATYVTRQISGPSVKLGGGQVTLPSPIPTPTPPTGINEAPPRQPGANGEQVTDFAQDTRAGGPSDVDVNNELDILSIKYSSTPSGATQILSATMKVSELHVLPPNATYRMTFTANAPDPVLSATGDYTYGLSDRGDQFFFAVTTTGANTPTYRYGTAVRNFNGSITYTNQGIADSGSFDTAAGTITVNVDVAKFNTLLATAGKPLIQVGSPLVGLRGTASAGATDNTRGGTLFIAGVNGLQNVVSRKTHGSAGLFDINLPLVGNPGIECRNKGDNAHTLIYTLDRNVAVAGTATTTQGTATAGTPTIGPLANQVTVNLTGVTNAQHLVITLNGVQDAAGTILNNFIGRMDVLLGDTSGNRLVNSTDISQVQAQSGKAVGSSNFRTDVTANGLINSTDISTVQSKSGTGL